MLGESLTSTLYCEPRNGSSGADRLLLFIPDIFDGALGDTGDRGALFRKSLLGL